MTAIPIQSGGAVLVTHVLGCSPTGHNAYMSGIVNEAVTGRPAAWLRPLIAYYSGYRQAAVGPAVHGGLPSPYLTLIFTLDEPLTIAEHPDPHQRAADYLTLAGGLHTVPALVTHDGWQSGIQLGRR
jgi:hypothetical protein